MFWYFLVKLEGALGFFGTSGCIGKSDFRGDILVLEKVSRFFVLNWVCLRESIWFFSKEDEDFAFLINLKFISMPLCESGP